MSGTLRNGRLGVPFLALLYVIPVWLWAGTAASFGGFGTWFDTIRAALTHLADVFGLVGTTAFAANLILGARLPFVTSLFGGLDAMYRAHRANGRVAYLLLASHVVLVFGSRADFTLEHALGLFTPSAGRTILLGVAAFASLTVAVALTLYARLGHEVFIWVQRSFGIIFGIGAFHFLVIEGAKTSQPLIKTYLIAVTVAGVLAFAYRSLFGDVLVRRYEYVVSEAHELDPEVMEIAMDPVGPAIKPQPGQFVYATFYSDEFDSQFHPVTVAATGESATIVLRPGDVKNQFHPFSVTSTPDDRSLRLVVKAVGGFTRALHRLKPGAVARIEGPYGEFSYLRLQHPRQVWVAGGIGITPFLSMARSLPAGGEHEITLFYGVKTRKEAFFAPELQALSERVEGFSVVVVPEDEEGFITTDRILTSQDLTSIDVMICGPPAMVAALRTSLSAAGVPPRNVHGERFGFGPRG